MDRRKFMQNAAAVATASFTAEMTLSQRAEAFEGVMIEGLPTVSAGDVVELKQFGVRYSGRYLVQSAQHLVQAGAQDPYTTRLQLVRNAAPEP